MYLCTAPLSRFYYPETRRFINAFYYYYYYYYNNSVSFRMLHGLPMSCSASGISASSRVNRCKACISQETRIHTCQNAYYLLL